MVRIGDTIELKTRYVRRQIKLLGLNYFRTGTQEFITGYASEVLMFLSAYLKVGSNPRGKLVALGAYAGNKESRYYIVTVKNSFGKAIKLPVLTSDFKVVQKKKKKMRETNASSKTLLRSKRQGLTATA